ncbi:Uncharacterised protein [uncultured archaeon]|nr:Uncharacterised protein [uncultured archaeon]
MPTPLPNPDKYIPALQDNSRRLIDLSINMLQRVPCSEEYTHKEDHFALMGSAFISKQIDHLESIRMLVRENQHKDAGLIARSMVEGTCILFWARDPDTKCPEESRAFLWRGYSVIHDFRAIRERKRAGKRVDSGRKAWVTDWFGNYSKFYLDPKAKSKSDPYRHDSKWSGHTVRELCESVKEIEKISDTFYEIYKATSAWVHWTPEALAGSIQTEGNCITYTSQKMFNGVGLSALVTGIESLLLCTFLLESHSHLGYGERLKEFDEEFASLQRNWQIDETNLLIEEKFSNVRQ